jgi:hypothetical protein
MKNREYRKYTDNTYSEMLKEKGIDNHPKKGYDYSKIRVKNSEDWHKFEFRKRGKSEDSI